MKKLFLILTTIIGSGFYLWMILACATTEQVPSIDYSAVYVPEESGYKFHKISDDLDGINASVTKDFGKKYLDIYDHVFDLSKDNEKIIFQSVEKKSDQWTANYYLKKTNQLKIKQQRTFHEFAQDGALSPDGKSIVYINERGGNTNLFLIGAESGAKIQQITNTTNFSYNPVYRPDGKLILFTEQEVSGRTYSSSQGKYVNTYEEFLWSYNMDNGSLIQYGKGYNADFFQDGERVVCVRNDDQKPSLWIFNLDSGQEFTLLSDPEKGFVQPSISPDGKTIAFVSVSGIGTEQGVNFDIYTIKEDGTGLTQITFHPGHDYNPKWSKDGKSLYFVSQRGTTDGIHNIWKVEI